ncbi:MAG: type II toxin-antitoxin system HipA family toxin [Verrucomicrobiae bacterium]
MILSAYIGNERIGRLADSPAVAGRILFEYDAAWRRKGIELSPFHLPTSLAGPTFFDSEFPQVKNLPGLMWDSLPDSWGMPLLERRLREAEHDPAKATGTVFLSHVGHRGMGAIRYEPDHAGGAEHRMLTSLRRLDDEASRVQQDQAPADFQSIHDLIQTGSAIGGAKPKAAVYIDLATDRVSVSPDAGFEPWVVKLSTVPAEHKDSRQAGRVEYAVSNMARAAGIQMPETRIFPVKYSKGERGLFGIKRFDRNAGVSRVHVQTYAALRHIIPVRGAGSYEMMAQDVLALSGDQRDVAELFRRGVFNVLSGNRDDHLKNFSFLMDGDWRWRLAPAYDITPSPGPQSLHERVSARQCTAMNGTLSPALDDMLACAEAMDLDGPKIIREVQSALSGWMGFAQQAGLKASVAEKVKDGFRIERPARKAGKPKEQLLSAPRAAACGSRGRSDPGR